jgi:hypothetical protein
MSQKPPRERTHTAAKRVIVAIDRIIKDAEELKRANAALSLEAHRPPLRVVTADPQEGDQDDE